MRVKKAIFLLASLFLVQSLHAQTMRICYEDAENFPWNVQGGQGLNNQLVALASKQSAVKIELFPLPWKRCLFEVSKGRVEGAMGASYTEERASFAAYPMANEGKLDPKRRLRFDGYSLYRRKGSSVGWDGKFFSNLSGAVDIQLGYAVATDLQKMGVPFTETGGDARVHLKKLVMGQVPLTALLSYEGDALLQEPEFSNAVERVQPAFSEKPYFVIFNKSYYANNSKAVEKLWGAIASVRESLAFQKLVRDKQNQLR